MGFFDDAYLGRKPIPVLPRCGECKLYKGLKHGKMQVAGEGKKKIMIVGEAPGRNENEEGLPFVGPAGQQLQRSCREAGLDLFEDCWVVNAARCWPAPDNKLPDKAIEHCRPYTVKDIQTLKPEIIILLGFSAVRSVLGWIWKEDVGNGIGRWTGWRIPCQKLNTWICPLWHPSYLIRIDKKNPKKSERQNEIKRLLFNKQLKRAVKLKGRPWEKVPDYKSQVQVLLNPDDAVSGIREFLHGNKPIAFDYETSMLKPDSKDGFIYSCSISDGQRTIAYPWHGQSIKETKTLLQCRDIPKIGCNAKFEHRFSLASGIEVHNWVWDTMITAHVLDNRPGITGLKFQSFVLLGQDSYDQDIKPFLKSKGSNIPNRIKEAPLQKLLVYNGMDSLLEVLVAKKQAKQMGVDL